MSKAEYWTELKMMICQVVAFFRERERKERERERSAGLTERERERCSLVKVGK